MDDTTRPLIETVERNQLQRVLHYEAVHYANNVLAGKYTVAQIPANYAQLRDELIAAYKAGAMSRSRKEFLKLTE